MTERDVLFRGPRRLMRACIAGVALALLGLVVPASQARADQTFHTQQIPLMPVSGAPLHNGFVVDVHTNGPTIYAVERYVLNGAEPITTYQVQTLAYANGTNCASASPLVALQDALLTTNVTGNGEAGHVKLNAGAERLERRGGVKAGLLGGWGRRPDEGVAGRPLLRARR